MFSNSRDLADEQKTEILEIQDKETNMLQTLFDKLRHKGID